MTRAPSGQEAVDPAWHTWQAAEVLDHLQTGSGGLSEDEAEARLQRYGPNVLPEQKRMTPLRILLHQFADPLVYFLGVAAAVTIVLGEYIDAGVIAAVLVINALIGFTQELGAERAMESLARMAAPRARVLRQGTVRSVQTATLVPGDMVLIEAGDRVPADLRLIDVRRLRTEEAALTGESLPVDKQAEALAAADLPAVDQRNMAFLGTTVTVGRAKGVVVATGAATRVGRIATAMRQARRVGTPLQERMARFSKVIGLLVVAVAVAGFLIGVGMGRPAAEMFLLAVALAVSAIPEGLPVVLTLTLAIGVRRMAGRGAIIRKLPAVETLGSTTVIGSDKTGTLTQNRMTVQRVYAGGRLYAVDEAGVRPLAASDADPDAAAAALRLCLRIGLLANDARLEAPAAETAGAAAADPTAAGAASGDPTEVALLVAAVRGGLQLEAEAAAMPRIDEIPFTSERRYMASLHAAAGRRLVLVKGAPEALLPLCTTAASAGGEPTALQRDTVAAVADDMAADGLRVLAMAYRELPPDSAFDEGAVTDLCLAGLQGMIDPPRPEVYAAVAGAQQAGIRVLMITGDHAVTAGAIARRLGIAGTEQGALTGRDLTNMDDRTLKERLREVSVFARVEPEQKLRLVRLLQDMGHVVAVTGDGVNDAPALRAAHIGVAMGRDGTDVARDAADMVLTDDNFSSIYAAVGEGRVVFENIRKVVFFLLSSSAGEVAILLTALALGLPLPLLPAQILWVNLVTNGLQDVALAFEPGEPGVVRRRPRPPGEGVFTRLMVWRTALVGLVLAAGTLTVFVWELNRGTDEMTARTAAVTTLVLFQFVHAFNSRSFDQSLLGMAPLGNRFLVGGVLVSLVAQLLFVYWGPAQTVFRTAPLALETWLVIAAVSLTVLAAVEADKALRRRRHSTAS